MKHLLVIRLSAMGDVAISVPVLNAFSEQYPEVKLTILTRPLFAPMFAHLHNCTVFSVDLKGKHKGIFGLFRLFRELKKLAIDGVADIHNVLRTNILKFFFTFSNIPFKQIDKGRKEKKQLTRASQKIFKPLKPSFQRYADVFEALGFPILLEKKYISPKFSPSEKVKNLLSDKKNIGIAPFAAHLGKQFPFERLKTIISELSVEKKYKIFIFGGGNAEKNLINTLSHLENVENMVGKLSFSEELELISHLDLMVAMDSGNAHLSAMYGIPTLTFWGATHPFAGFYPYNQPLDNALFIDRKQYPLVPTSVYGNVLPKGYETMFDTIPNEVILWKIRKLAK